VNVGGRNKLPMKDLVAIFAEAGCAEVRNYIQSGNIIFQATSATARKIPGTVTSQIEQRFGFQTTLVMRTAEQVRQVAENNPFLKAGESEELLSVMFLSSVPGAEAIAKLDPQRSPPDRFIVQGDTIYLHTPNGLADTKLTNAYFDSKLQTVSTARNWRTVLKLLEMAGA
jgi:uncharacterized protein (DUF1697 family)